MFIFNKYMNWIHSWILNFTQESLIDTGNKNERIKNANQSIHLPMK